MDKETDVLDPEKEDLESTIDFSTPEGKRQLIEIAKEELRKETENKKERKSIDLGAAGKRDPQPVNKGNRVARWDRRGLRVVQSIAGMEHSEHGKRSHFGSVYAQCVNDYVAMADSQREAEDKEARAIVRAAYEDGFIGKKAELRILNLLDDPEEKEFLSQTRVHTTLTGPAGEFLVPKPMLATIYTIIEEYGLAQRLATNITMGSKDLDLNSISTAPTATWTGENVLFTESDLALGQNVLSTHKLGAVSSISMELEEDALVPLIPQWLRKVAENIALKIDQSFLLGDGTSTYGLMVGISNAGSVNTNTLGASDLAPTDVTETDFRTTKRLLSSVRRIGAQWVMPRVLWDYVEEFESTVGARIVQEMLTADPRMRFLGFPVNLSEAMDNTDGDAANRDFAILGDFRNTLVGTRRGVTVETSTDGVLSNSSGVVQLNAFQQDAMLVKISLRIGHQTPTGVQSGYAVMNAPAA